MPHSDAIPASRPFNDQHAHVRTAFVARLKPGAHLLNGQCGMGEDLCWLRAEGYIVTACEAVLADARVASQQSGQAVRVCPLAKMHSVLPYDGIWLSRPLDSDAATLVPLGEGTKAFSHLERAPERPRPGEREAAGASAALQ